MSVIKPVASVMVGARKTIHPTVTRAKVVIIEKGERRRSAYYNYYTGKQWGHSSGYHLCIDSSVMGIEGTAEFIAKFIHDGKARP